MKIQATNPLKLGVVAEFKSFLLKHGVVGLAVGVVIGGAVGKVVKAMVDDLIMPIVGMFTPEGDWRTLKMGVGKLQFGVGDLMGNVIDFVIISFVIFLIVKNLLKEAPPVPGPATKTCPKCAETVLAAATRCKHCTSEV